MDGFSCSPELRTRIADAFRGTLSPSAQIRAESEAEIRNSTASLPDFPLVCLYLLADDAIELGVRKAMAIWVKNACISAYGSTIDNNPNNDTKAEQPQFITETNSNDTNTKILHSVPLPDFDTLYDAVAAVYSQQTPINELLFPAFYLLLRHRLLQIGLDSFLSRYLPLLRAPALADMAHGVLAILILLSLIQREELFTKRYGHHEEEIVKTVLYIYLDLLENLLDKYPDLSAQGDRAELFRCWEVLAWMLKTLTRSLRFVTRECASDMRRFGRLFAGLIRIFRLPQPPEMAIMTNMEQRQNFVFMKSKKWATLLLYNIFARFVEVPSRNRLSGRGVPLAFEVERSSLCSFTDPLSKKFSDEFIKSYAPQILGFSALTLRLVVEQLVWIPPIGVCCFLNCVDLSLRLGLRHTLSEQSLDVLHASLAPNFLPSDDDVFAFHHNPAQYVLLKESLDEFEAESREIVAASSVLRTLLATAPQVELTDLFTELEYAVAHTGPGSSGSLLADPHVMGLATILDHKGPKEAQCVALARLAALVYDSVADGTITAAPAELGAAVRDLVFRCCSTNVNPCRDPFVQAEIFYLIRAYLNSDPTAESHVTAFAQMALHALGNSECPGLQVSALLTLQTCLGFPAVTEQAEPHAADIVRAVLGLGEHVGAELTAGVLEELVETFHRQLDSFVVPLVAELCNQVTSILEEFRVPDAPALSEDSLASIQSCLGAVKTILLTLDGGDSATLNQLEVLAAHSFYVLLAWEADELGAEFASDVLEIIEHFVLSSRRVSEVLWELFDVLVRSFVLDRETPEPEFFSVALLYAVYGAGGVAASPHRLETFRAVAQRLVGAPNGVINKYTEPQTQLTAPPFIPFTSEAPDEQICAGLKIILVLLIAIEDASAKQQAVAVLLPLAVGPLCVMFAEPNRYSEPRGTTKMRLECVLAALGTLTGPVITELQQSIFRTEPSADPSQSIFYHALMEIQKFISEGIFVAEFDRKVCAFGLLKLAEYLVAGNATDAQAVTAQIRQVLRGSSGGAGLKSSQGVALSFSFENMGAQGTDMRLVDGFGAAVEEEDPLLEKVLEALSLEYLESLCDVLDEKIGEALSRK